MKYTWMWCVIFVLYFLTVTEALQLSPNVRSLHVIKGEYKEIDCFQDASGDTIDIKWTGPQGNISNVATRKTSNPDGSFTFHHILKLPPFSLEDVGTYTCTYTTGPTGTVQTQIVLYLQEKCQYGKYGEKCNLDCSQNCKPSDSGNESPCSPVDGTCTSGCKSGYLGSHCTTECDYGKYGDDCSQFCSQKCETSSSRKESPCLAFNGSCRFGCGSGYMGSMCTEECGYGKYGANCSKSCSKNCMTSGNKTPCSPFDGNCEFGCTSGYQGADCTTKSSEETLNDGKIAAIVIVPVVLLTAIVVVAIYCRMKRREKKGYETDAEKSDKGSEKSLLRSGEDPKLSEDPEARAADIENLKAYLDCFKEVIEGVIGAEQKTKVKVEQKKMEKQALDKKEQKLKEEVEILKQNLRGQNDKLLESVTEEARKAGAALEAKEEKERELRKVRFQLKNKEYELERLQEEKDKSSELVNELKDELLKRDAEIADLEKQLKEVKAKLRETTKTNKELREELADAQETIKRLREENEAMQSELGFKDLREKKTKEQRGKHGAMADIETKPDISFRYLSKADDVSVSDPGDHCLSSVKA